MKQNNDIDIKIKMYLYYIIKDNVNLHTLMKSIASVLLRNYIITEEIKECTFFYFMTRNDHIDRFRKIYRVFPRKKCICTLKKCIRLNFENIIYMFKDIRYISNINEFNVFDDKDVKINSFLFKIIFYVKLIHYNSLAKYYKSLDLSGMKCLIVYCDTCIEEYLFVKEANAQGKKTVTCQHGFYPVDLSLNTIHVLNYWNAPSKYALVWGEITGSQYNKYSPNTKVLYCGDMNLFGRNFDRIKNTIGILMDIPANKSYNQNMINIVERVAIKHKMKVWIRIHPTDNISGYNINSKVSSFKSDNENAEFFVAHTSTMLFSCIAEGRNIFVYKSDMKFYDLDDKICFSDSIELEDCMGRLNQINWKKIIEPFYCCIGNEAKQKYIDFFNEYLQ